MIRYIRAAMRETKDRGASAVEYGLMVAAIAAVIVGIVFGLGSLVSNIFDNTCQSLATGQSVGAANPANNTSCTGVRRVPAP